MATTEALTLSNTERATLAGQQRAYELLRREYPEISHMEAELEVKLAAHDWAAGREGEVRRRWEKRYGVLLAAMLLAHLLADAEPSRTPATGH